ncbi:MAG TPA: DUF4097 family beta strand repeat-containing protein [Candidatus Sulfopaludibacter sp.]|jgi:DUF4097 and DUF4098 domain-containing protein YvlB|nr:DUF4097 family beta strand repeat-containing protein [Candidatus Sulfopaludibacter sp.]
MRVKGTLGLLSLLLSGSALYANVIGNPHVDFHQTFALGPSGRVLIQNLYGDVSITAWDRDEVLVEAIKRSPDPKRLDDARIIVEPSSGGLSIHTVYTGADAEHPASVEYRIMVPRRANLDQVKLVNGGLSISGVAGPIKASSVNGSIRADKLEGQADLSTVNGTLDAAFNRVSASKPISLSSVNGPIKLCLPAGAAASLNAHNLSGGIESDVGRVSRADDGHDLHAVLNHGGAAIRVHNVNGGISIHSTWSHRMPKRT